MIAPPSAAHLVLARSGRRLHLLAQRAAWWAEEQALLVADVHLGKAQTFRRLGVAVPESTTADILARLDALLAATAARELIFLGDLLHAAQARSPALIESVAHWRSAHAHVRMTLVRGNHDDRAGDPPPGWAMDVVDEPWCRGGLALCHHPQAVPDHDAVGGHLHPGVVLAHGFERLRLPCFHLREGVLVLPAFGSFTGLHLVAPSPTDRVFAIVGDELRELPSG